MRTSLAANEEARLTLVRSVAGVSADPATRQSRRGFPNVSPTQQPAAEREAYEALQLSRLVSEYATRQRWLECEKREIDKILERCIVAKDRRRRH